MGVIILDFDNRISMANKAALKFLDEGTEEEIIGTPIEQLVGSLATEMNRLPQNTTETIRLSD